VLVSLKDAFKGPAVPASLENSPIFQRRARHLNNCVRLAALAGRLSRCADKIRLRQYDQLLDALQRPKPRALKADRDYLAIAIAVEDFRMRRLAEGASERGLREQAIREVIYQREANERPVSERKVRAALERYGKAARKMAAEYHRRRHR
jgi:hypothetical protein